MEDHDRYPPPDPSDPFAPLWVLRTRAASTSRRPSAPDGAPLPSSIASSARRSSSVSTQSSTLTIVPNDPQSGRCWPSSPGLPPSPVPSRVLPKSLTPQSYDRPFQPRLAFSPSYEHQHQQAPEVGSKDQARVHKRKFSRLFAASKRSSADTEENTIHIPRFRQDNHHRLQKSQRRTASSSIKPTISPPVISTAAWESQVTGRQFLPISAKPILTTAFSVQQQHPVVIADAALDTSSNEDTLTNSFRHGRAMRSDAGGTGTINIKSLSAPAFALLPSLPSQKSKMHDASGIEILSSSELLPPSSCKQGGPLNLAPITTTTRNSSSSSYYEIFTTPNASPIETQNALEQSSTQISVSSTIPPRDGLPRDFFLPPPPMTATPDVELSPQSASTTKAQCPWPPTIPATHRPQAEWSIPTTTQLAFAASLQIYQSDGTPIQFGTLFAEHRTIVLFLRHFFCPLCQDYVSSLASIVKQPILRETGALCAFNDEDVRVLTDVCGDEPRQVQLVLISCGKATLVDKYKDMFKLPFRIFTDPDAKVYDALGMGKIGDEAGSVTGVSGKLRNDNVPQHLSERRAEVRPPSSQTMTEKETVRDGGYVKHGMMGGIAMVVMRALKVGMPIWQNGGDISQLGGEFVLGPGLTCTFAHRMQDAKGHAPVLDVLTAANVRIPDEILHPSPYGGVAAKGSAVRKEKERVLVKKSRPKSISISGFSHWSPMSLLHPPHTVSLNGHGNSKNRAPGSVTRSVDGHGAIRRQHQESLVTATLRSRAETAALGFKNTHYTSSRDSLGSGGASSEYHYHRRGGYSDRDVLPAPLSLPTSSQRSHVEQEKTRMDNRKQDLEMLKKRKYVRRQTGSGLGSGVTETVPGETQTVSHHYPDDDPSELSTLEFGPASVSGKSQRSLMQHDRHSHHSHSHSSRSSTSEVLPLFNVSPSVSGDSSSNHDDALGGSGVVGVGNLTQVVRHSHVQQLKRFPPKTSELKRSNSLSISATLKSIMRG